MTRLALTAIGGDRPGIVAAVTGALADLDGNLADTAMTVLGGQFAIVLLLDVADDITGHDVAASLEPVADELGLAIDVRPATAPATVSAGIRHQLTVYGADRPGIVATISAGVARHGANVVDLETRVTGSPEDPAYVMLMDLDVPEGNSDDLASALTEVGVDLGVTCHLRPVDADVF